MREKKNIMRSVLNVDVSGQGFTKHGRVHKVIIITRGNGLESSLNLYRFNMGTLHDHARKEMFGLNEPVLVIPWTLGWLWVT